MSYLVSFCSCVISCFSIAITSLGDERTNLSAFVRLFDLRLFGFVCFLFLLVSGKGCGCDCGTTWTFLLRFFFFFFFYLIIRTIEIKI